MAPVFTPRADLILRAVLAVLGLVVLVLLLWLAGLVDPGGRETGARAAPAQPAAFSHRLHVGQVGIDCRMCHTSVALAPEAGYPQQWTCAGCHLALDPPPRIDWTVAWTRVQPLPDHVYFHHGIHVSRGIACATCHGAVADMVRVYPVREFTMQWCLDCHRNPAPHLNPPGAVFTTAAGAPEAAPDGPALLRAYGIDTARLDHCYVCHR